MALRRSYIFDAAKKLGARFRNARDVAVMDRAIDVAEGKPSSTATIVAPSSIASILPKLASSKGPALAAIVGSIAATSLLASVPEEEGWKLEAYRDIAGIVTICGGDTKNVRMGMVETEAGCQRRLEAQLIAHAKPVVSCTPRLQEEGRDWQRAAAVSLAYNIGVGAWCRSTADRRFDVGDWAGGCNAFLSWNKARVKGTLRPVLGLTRRRQRERQMCLKGIV